MVGITVRREKRWSTVGEIPARELVRSTAAPIFQKPRLSYRASVSNVVCHCAGVSSCPLLHWLSLHMYVSQVRPLAPPRRAMFGKQSFDTSLSTIHRASRRRLPFTAFRSERIPTRRTISLGVSLTTNLQSAKYPSAMLAHLTESSINLRTSSAWYFGSAVSNGFQKLKSKQAADIMKPV